MKTPRITPCWAPRVPQHKIRQLYWNDAKGIYDEELINEVGYALLARCQSSLEANQAFHGEVICPVCSQIIFHTGDKAEVLSCKKCSWTMTWGEYFATFQHKQLYGAELVLELFRDFTQRFMSASNLREKVLIIDRLIHGFHWNQKYGNTRPVAVNLIEGRLSDVITFLDNLTYSLESTEGLQDTYTVWMMKSQYVRSWACKQSDSGNS
jgi:hypothetical protein